MSPLWQVWRRGRACLLVALAMAGCDPILAGRAGRAGPARDPLPARPMMTPAPATPAASTDDGAASIERETASRLNARLDLSAPWRPMAFGASYLAPDDLVARDGGVDVIVHFHGAIVVDQEWRASQVDAVIVNVTLPGYGVAPYREMFAAPGRFGAIVDDAVKRRGGTHLRRLGLVSWSAGYGAVQEVLSEPRYYAMVDTVVLFDGMHADYVEGLPEDADVAIFERFARDAVAGDKQMVVTHSAVAPPGYASTTETATMLLASAGALRVEEKKTNARGMIEWYHADRGGLHVRGFRGDGPRDHMDQVHLLGEVMRTFVAPRWTRRAILDEQAGRSRRSSDDSAARARAHLGVNFFTVPPTSVQ
jgi:hypothetical protein